GDRGPGRVGEGHGGPPHPADGGLVTGGERDGRAIGGDRAGGDALVAGAGHPAADAVLGRDGSRGPGIPRHGVVDLDRGGHRADGDVDRREPYGRLAPRPARPYPTGRVALYTPSATGMRDRTQNGIVTVSAQARQ